MMGTRFKLSATVFGMAVISACLVVPGYPKELNFEATTDRNRTSVGRPLQLNLTFNETQQMPAPELPEIDGFQGRYLGPATSMSVINGRVSSSISHMYSLVPVKKGSFTIGPFIFNLNGDTYRSNKITIEVGEGSAQEPAGSSGQASFESQDLSERIFMVIQPQKKTAYVNEMIPVTVKLYVNRLGVRDIQFPKINHEGLLTGEFGRPRQYPEALGGVNYEVIEFATTVFATRPGEFRLGPAELKCNIVVRKENRRRASSIIDDFFDSNVFDDFFGGYEAYPYAVSSPEIPFTAMPLPEENKPAGFTGTLGSFDLDVGVSPGELAVGDPVTVKVAVRGKGNFNTVTMPPIDFGDGFKAYSPQVKMEQDAKVFEQVVIPLNAELKELPAVNFSFFNTQTGVYETITRGPFPLTVKAAGNTGQPAIVESKTASREIAEEKLGRDIIYVKESPGKPVKTGGELYKNKVFLAFQIVPLALWLFIAAGRARKQRITGDVRYARQLLAPRKAKQMMSAAKKHLDKGDTREFYDALFATLQEYLGNKFHLASKSITVSVIDDTLKPAGVAEDVRASLGAIFRECDMVRYASSQFSREQMSDSLRNLEEAIDYFQRRRS